MAKDKMNIPQIRFKGFEGEWNNELLKNLLSFSNGVNAPKENYGKGRKMISVLDILNKGRLHYSNILNSVFVDNITEQKNKVVKGDLVFVRSSEIVEEVGLAKAYLDDDYALHSGFTICGTKISDFDSFFLELSLNSVNRKEVERKAGGSTRYNVSQTVLNDIYLFMPSQSEQTQIGDFFQKIDQVIELQQKVLDTARAYKQSMLQKMFPQKGEKVPRVRFAGFSGDWEENRLKEVISSEFKGKAQLSKLKNGDVEYLDAERLNGGMPYLSNAELDVDYKDILILWDGSKAGTVYKGFQGALGSTLKAYKIMKKHSSEFIYQSLKYRQAEIFEKYRTPNIPHVIKDFTELFKIKLPSLEEQTQIGNFFEILDQQIEQQAQKLATYQQLKKAMLQRMFV